MKPSFHTKLLNGPFEDPGLYVRIIREGRGLLFDLGFTKNLSVRDILKITDIFVSHTHIDHFTGFDNILRICLKREAPLRLYGPEGFIKCVAGKLSGYTWNLTGDYPLVIEVSEVSGDVVKKAVFRADKSFRLEESGKSPFTGDLVKEPLFSVSAAILDHQIPCLAFSLREDYHINIDKAELDRLNLSVGPWLGEFKTAIRESRTDNLFLVEGKQYRMEDIRDAAKITAGQKISYVVDALGSDENRNKIIELVKDSHILYIEAYFLNEDRTRAGERYHLTAKEAGRIAGEANVQRLEVIHFSPRYTDGPERLVNEAENEFKRWKARDNIFMENTISP